MSRYKQINVKKDTYRILLKWKHTVEDIAGRQVTMIEAVDMLVRRSVPEWMKEEQDDTRS